MKPELRPGSRPGLCWAALALLAALAACGDAGKQNAQATAGGEVLESSVSDAMLPVDRVRSQPPLAPKSEGGEPGKKSGASGKGGGGSAPAEAAAQDAPEADAPESGGDSAAPAETTPGGE